MLYVPPIKFYFYLHLANNLQESGYPIVDVIYETTGSYAATCVLISFLIVLLFFSAVSTVASSSRQIWSFARDHVSPKSQFNRAAHIN